MNIRFNLRSICISFILTLILFPGVQIIVACQAETESEAGSETDSEEQVLEQPEFIPEWVTQAVSGNNLEYVVFHSDAVGEDVSFHIYLPEAYHEDTSGLFPVLYYLHGSGPGTVGIPFLSSVFGDAIRKGLTRPMLVVFPNGLPIGMWCDSKDGKIPVESMVMNDLIPYVDKHYRTIDTASGRLVEGFSMGGYGAARLGLKHHSVFGGFSMLGAGPLQLDFTTGPIVNDVKRQEILTLIFGGDMDYFVAQSPWILAEQYAAFLPPDMPVRQIIGTLDELLENNRHFHQHLTSSGIIHQYLEIPRIGHNPRALFNAMDDSFWSFYEQVFGGH